jgi:hypothetical protein
MKSKAKKITIDIVRSKEPTKRYGMISKIILPDKSKIYVSKKGWTLVTPKGVEMIVPWFEVNIAIAESIAQKYFEIPKKR